MELEARKLTFIIITIHIIGEDYLVDYRAFHILEQQSKKNWCLCEKHIHFAEIHCHANLSIWHHVNKVNISHK